ncbi:hypothetical protein T07_2221 [Trichinella nelsoni]|uniref:Uncharacterized protein n=1 Tax=Trichinella nelsoni TaxID=6336 RepID=A0A0V0S665_9BILA|nr:hypothetical protein T07_2221 [Trichinella nelsoni]
MAYKGSDAQTRTEGNSRCTQDLKSREKPRQVFKEKRDRGQQRKIRKGRADQGPQHRSTRLPLQDLDLTIVAWCNKYLKRLFGVRFVNNLPRMSSSRRVVGRKVNSDERLRWLVGVRGDSWCWCMVFGWWSAAVRFITLVISSTLY